ncbi:MAG: ATP-binding cassette domain-containing protein [Proteobacteria bacterium]|nr:MAG: ATP-binding cassette domain-containing protein [Pseudomonadota bacterium]
MQEPIIQFKHFNFKYQNLVDLSLKDINLDIFAGERILITGRSGSGKSTLLHAINGIIPLTNTGEITGNLSIRGVSPNPQHISEISNQVGTILQDQDSQFIGLSVGEDVAFSLENSCINTTDMQHIVKDSLNKVQMYEFIDYSPYELSGGQKQSVSLAGVLSASPEILLFDEPLANLDPQSVVNISKLIRQLNQDSHKTIIIVEHRIEECLEIGIDRIVVMDNGQIIQIGTPNEILKSNIFTRLGIRQPFYVEALQFASITPTVPLNDYQSITNLDSNDKTRLTQWALSLPTCNPNRETIVKNHILELKNISFHYTQNKPILQDINFTVRQGEIVSILGNNGAGKSTLTQVIAGIYHQNSGDILVNNTSISHQSIKERGQQIAVIMQNPNHMLVKTVVWDEVALGLANAELDSSIIHNKVEQALRVCGIWGYRNWPIAALSYGQKKRVTIASMLVLEPKILILDEPTAGQDLRTYHEFMKFIQTLAQTGIAVLIITHDLYLALEYSTRSLIMNNSRIIGNGSPNQLFMNDALLAQANLTEISLSKLAKWLNIAPDKFIASYIINKQHQGIY